MTTVVFYKGVMGSDTLMTEFKAASENLDPEDVKDFEIVDFKLQFRRVITNGITDQHLFGASGCVGSIHEFFKNYSNYKTYKPKNSITIMEWDGEDLTLYQTESTITWLGAILTVLSCHLWKCEDTPKKKRFWTRRIVRSSLTWDGEGDEYICLGSGAHYAKSAYEKMKFQFKRHNQNVDDHFTPEEIISYMIKMASRCDVFTNDKLLFASFVQPDEEQYTCIPSECESVERVTGNM